MLLRKCWWLLIRNNGVSSWWLQRCRRCFLLETYCTRSLRREDYAKKLRTTPLSLTKSICTLKVRTGLSARSCAQMRIAWIEALQVGSSQWPIALRRAACWALGAFRQIVVVAGVVLGCTGLVLGKRFVKGTGELKANHCNQQSRRVHNI